MAALFIVALARPVCISQEPAIPVGEQIPGLLALAKTPPEAALDVALAHVRGGAFVAAQLERRHGRLTYSFDQVDRRQQQPSDQGCRSLATGDENAVVG
ncbi:MAG: hypothetical protein GTO22_17575 [Gemmatimonadales bacterium]|nr:hypothetical protein [Gemmatimonadales bacterium]